MAIRKETLKKLERMKEYIDDFALNNMGQPPSTRELGAAFDMANVSAYHLLQKMAQLGIGEVCALQWSDIDFNRQTLKVSKTVQRVRITEGVSGKSYNEWLAGADENSDCVRKTKLILTDPKSETSIRTIPIPKSLMEYIKKFHDEDTNEDTFVLSNANKPLEPRTMQSRFARVLEKENLPSVHFHSLRHYFASLCIKLGFDVKALSEILGHSSVEITLNRYVHTSFDMKVEYMNRLKMKG